MLPNGFSLSDGWFWLKQPFKVR
ncbi:hypothetical protein ERY430_30032 [Erythrobacter sp. EC-HK427]|nr:hypothetical protein ERY430_30032 [Erythrobacter sp. EC-HK427]